MNTTNHDKDTEYYGECVRDWSELYDTEDKITEFLYGKTMNKGNITLPNKWLEDDIYDEPIPLAINLLHKRRIEGLGFSNKIDNTHKQKSSFIERIRSWFR